MNYNIRTAVPADTETINALFAEMLNAVYHTDNAEGYPEGYLDRFFDGSENRIYLAEGEEIMAFLSVEVHREEKTYIYLDDFSVSGPYRRQGIGTKLIRAAESYAEELRIPAICLHVEKTNSSAFRFYEKLGYSVMRDDGNRYLMLKEEKAAD